MVDQVKKMIVDWAEVWHMSSEKYGRAVVEKVEQNISKYNQRLPTRFKTPIMSGYQPKTDTSPDLKAKGLTQYQYMVRVIR